MSLQDLQDLQNLQDRHELYQSKCILNENVCNLI